MRGSDTLYIDGGDPFDLRGGCTLDGLPVSCSFAMQAANSGAAAVVPGDGQTTRYNSETKRFEFFQAFADGYQGYVPNGANYLGGGLAWVPGVGTGLKIGGQVVIPDSEDEPGYFTHLSQTIGAGFGIGLFSGWQPTTQQGKEQKKVAWVTLVTPCGQPTWEQLIGPDGIFNQLLNPLGVAQSWTGANFRYVQTVPRSFGDFVAKAKELGWEGFSTDPHYKHWGDDDFRLKYNGEWYHLSVKRPIVTDFDSGAAYDASAPPPAFSIHWEEAQPGSWRHFVNFVSSTLTRTPIEQYRGLPPCK